VIDRLLKLNIGAVLGLFFILLIGVFTVTGQIGEIGIDNDDVMRLAQIRDFLGGQSWYDHHQYRMGLDGGTLMHWSRVIDLPVILLISVFDLFLPYAWAEAIAISIWPVMTGLALILSVKLLSRDHAGFIIKDGDMQRAIWGFGLLIIGLFLITFYRFAPGRLDHHNIQFAALAFSYVGLSDPQMKPRRFALAGAMTGLSLVIGTEALPFLAVNCGFAALLWGYKGAAVSRAVTAFGAAFAAVLLAGFLIDTPPAAYGQIYCDILAVNYLVLGMSGGLGLAILARAAGLNTVVKRAVGLGVLGGVCAVILLSMSPQCLSNPLGQLPVNVQTLWLDYVEEAQPLFSKRSLGFTPARLYGLALSGAIIAMTLYQLRYASFGLIIGSLMLIPWVAECFVAGKAKSKDSVVYIFAFALSAASLWQMPALLIGEDDAVKPTTDVVAQNNSKRQAAVEDVDERRDSCFPESLETYLKTLPKTLILAEPNMTSVILHDTEHSAVNGNYHRNAAGIDRAVTIFMQPPEKAAQMMRESQIDLLFFCEDRAAYGIYAKAGPDGLAARLVDKGEMTGFVKVPLDMGDKMSLWKPK